MSLFFFDPTDMCLHSGRAYTAAYRAETCRTSFYSHKPSTTLALSPVVAMQSNFGFLSSRMSTITTSHFIRGTNMGLCDMQNFWMITTGSAVEILSDPCHTKSSIHQQCHLSGKKVPQVVQ